ncbi:CPBP family glutamic-type intramembrane protease [Sphingomonas sp. BT-65]|uniref:CPBP family glutamic-type intramembrane protease n=1 Tax=Sphingomonas sp. BT-65 TaxID=2989821 RepID=UPI0022363044|nr:CPBP family glutamic-type intramembrane protease [Sphingomonas sp. BT-65]MCW4460557.1 CPBP family glutamic-type intramembrane protease [Sphingomonas sp. BT-65]
MLNRITRKVAAALSTPPARTHLGLCLIELAWLVPLLAVLGTAGGLLNWAPALNVATLKLALLAIAVPSLGEELFFRAALLPSPDPPKRFPWRAAAISTLLFVLWHPLQAPLFGPRWSELVLNPWFLLSAGALGLACARLYWKTASIWPAVLLHWTIVVLWKSLFGAPSPWNG